MKMINHQVGESDFDNPSKFNYFVHSHKLGSIFILSKLKLINGLICFEVNIIVFILLDLLTMYHPIRSFVGHENFDNLDIWKHIPIGH